MKKTRVVILLLMLMAVGAQAETRTFVIGPEGASDSVLFRSTAKLEFIEGKTISILGHFEADLADLTKDVSGVVRVDLRDLRTGIETRDEHMRDRHLHTEKYPYAWFELEAVRGLDALGAGDSVSTGIAEGYFHIHGGKRSIEAELELSPIFDSADSVVSVSVLVSFQINLDDFGIDRPKALFLKLAETIEVEVFFVARSDVEPVSLEAPQWPERQ